MGNAFRKDKCVLTDRKKNQRKNRDHKCKFNGLRFRFVARILLSSRLYLLPSISTLSVGAPYARVFLASG